MADLGELKTVADWPKARPKLEKEIAAYLGKFPRERADLQIKTMDESVRGRVIRRRVNYFIDEWERVSAWLFIPEDHRDELPAILCCHDKVPQGKDEAAGIDGDPNLAFAHHYADLGYVTLAPDAVVAGERVANGAEPYDTKAYYKEKPPLSVLGKMLVDHMQALTVLEDFKAVDPARLGVIGHGLGGLNAVMLAAFDERIRACVASCPFARFAEDERPERWIDDAGYALLPKLKDEVNAKAFPWDWEHVLALAAPNPTLIFAALNDEILSNPKSIETAVKSAATVYKLLGRPEDLRLKTHQKGRIMNRALTDEADAWFERWL